MIKARVLSTNLSAKPDAPIEVNMEMWVFDNGSISCPDEVVIMTEEEYKALNSVSDVLRKSLLDEREKTKQLEEEVEKLKGANFKLKVKNADIRFDREILKEQSETIQKLQEENEAIQKDIKDLEEKMAQDATEVDIHPDGTIVFKKKRVSELEKEVEKLKEENKALKEDKFTMKITGGLFYKED